jgi:hypothetical protein
MSTGESSSLERSPAMHELSEHELKKQINGNVTFKEIHSRNVS